MLSPNARNLVPSRRGATLTVTENEHWAFRCWLSVAEQVTFDVPTGNSPPDATEHCCVTGAAPPVIVGVGYVMAAGTASTSAVWLAGQVIAGEAVGGGLLGPVGVPPPQPEKAAAVKSARRTRR